MAIVEVQFREQVFFDLIGAMASRMSFPDGFFNVGPGRLIERVAIGAVGLAPPGGPVNPPDEGALLLLVPFAVHHTTFADARLAGNLQPPATQQLLGRLWIELSTNAETSQLLWNIRRLEVADQFTPVLAQGDISLGPLDFAVERLALVAGSGVVALRLGTHADDMLSGPVVNRLGGADWGQLVAGQVFADALAVQLGEALDGAAKSSTDPKVEIDTRPSAHWSSVPPRAHSDAEITAVHAILGTIDVPIRIYATAELFPNAPLGHVELKITVHWYAHDFVTMASAGAIDWVEDDVSDAILEQFQAPPKGLEEVERDREHIVFRQRLPLSPLKLPLVWTTISAAAVDGAGLSATGAMTVAPPPVGFFTLEPPHWTSGIDCGSRSYKITFHPPAVHLVSSDRTFNQQFRAAVVEPAGLWIPTITWAAATASAPQVMSIVFEGPHQPTQPPAGSGSSAYINTNLGVRWVDFGNVPPKPTMPADPVATQVEVYNTCLLLTDRWGRGVLNLDWLVDPPDLKIGRPPLREWTVVAEGLVDVDRLKLVAVGPDGERSLAIVPIERGVVVVQVVTEQNETLRLDAAMPVRAPLPQLMQRWIVPTSAESRLEYAGDEERLHRTVGRGRSVAVRHRDHVVLGFAGPLVHVPLRGPARS